jgi:hypothetical protein
MHSYVAVREGESNTSKDLAAGADPDVERIIVALRTRGGAS